MNRAVGPRTTVIEPHPRLRLDRRLELLDYGPDVVRLQQSDPVVERSSELPWLEAEQTLELRIPLDDTGFAVPSPGTDARTLEHVDLPQARWERTCSPSGALHPRNSTAP